MERRFKGRSFLGSAFLNAIATDLQAYDSITIRDSQGRQAAETEHSPENKRKRASRKIQQMFAHAESDVRRHSLDEDFSAPSIKKKTVSFVCTEQEWDAMNDASGRLSHSKDDPKLLKSSLKKNGLHSFTERSDKTMAYKPVSVQEFLNARQKTQQSDRDNDSNIKMISRKESRVQNRNGDFSQEDSEPKQTNTLKFGGRPVRPRMSSREEANKDHYIAPRFSALGVDDGHEIKIADFEATDTDYNKSTTRPRAKGYSANDFLKTQGEFGTDANSFRKDFREKTTQQTTQISNQKIKEVIQKMKDKYRGMAQQTSSNFDQKLMTRLKLATKETKPEETLASNKHIAPSRQLITNPKDSAQFGQMSEPSTAKAKYPRLPDSLPHLSEFLKSPHTPLVKSHRDSKPTESTANINSINSVTNISNIHNNIAHIPNVNIHFNDKTISVTNSAIVAAYRNSHSSQVNNDLLAREKLDDAIYATDMYNLNKYRKRELSSSRLIGHPDKGFSSGSDQLGDKLVPPKKRMSNQTILNDSNLRNHGSTERSARNSSQKLVKLSMVKEKSRPVKLEEKFEPDRFLVGPNFSATGISIPGIKGIAHKENEDAFLIRKVELGGTECGFFCVVSGHGQYGVQVTQFIKKTIFRFLTREFH
jgi:hypothetical protein